MFLAPHLLMLPQYKELPYLVGTMWNGEQFHGDVRFWEIV
jgi:hypothetical protein